MEGYPAKMGRLKLWVSVLTDIKNCGTEDNIDGLTEFANAVEAICSDIHTLHCIVHMICSATKIFLYKDLKGVCTNLVEIHSAINAQADYEALEKIVSSCQLVCNVI